MVSAMETVGLLLWNTSNVTHIAEHLTLYTEFSRRLVPSHKQIQNMNIMVWKCGHSSSSAMKPEYKYMQNFHNNWRSTDKDAKNYAPWWFQPISPSKSVTPSLGDHANHIWFCEWFQPWLQFMPDILFTDEAQFTQDGNASTRNSHILPHENPQLVTQCHLQH